MREINKNTNHQPIIIDQRRRCNPIFSESIYRDPFVPDVKQGKIVQRRNLLGDYKI